MIRHVVDDLYQLGATVENQYGYEAVRIYVMMNDDAPILIDCGSHLHKKPIMGELNQLLGDATPSHIFLTHSELPHAGNIASVAEKWPAIKVIVSNVMLPYIEVLPVLPLEQITQVIPGTKIKIGNRTIESVSALLKDQPGSHWIYDNQTGTLFTGDGFGYFHGRDAIDKFNDELDGGILINQFESYHKLAFRFLEWIKPAKLNADLDTMFRNRQVNVIAPTHGSAIRSDIGSHLKRVKIALENGHQSYHTHHTKKDSEI